MSNPRIVIRSWGQLSTYMHETKVSNPKLNVIFPFFEEQKVDVPVESFIKKFLRSLPGFHHATIFLTLFHNGSGYRSPHLKKAYLNYDYLKWFDDARKWGINSCGRNAFWINFLASEIVCLCVCIVVIEIGLIKT